MKKPEIIKIEYGLFEKLLLYFFENDESQEDYIKYKLDEKARSIYKRVLYDKIKNAANDDKKALLQKYNEL